MNKSQSPSPVVLVILDGWGIAPPSTSNAITQAQTPQWDEWCQNGTLCELDASGNDVGLPAEQMGNSEVGHMHIGAGRILLQDLSQINADIKSGRFFENPSLLNALSRVKERNGRVHLLGLVSDGGVHSHETHLYALLELLQKQQIKDARIHCITDGRDTAPKDAMAAIKRLEKKIDETSSAKIASIMGRFYAMDRDKRWDRIEKAYDILTQSQQSSLKPLEIIANAYEKDITDEFIEPQASSEHLPILDNDLVICFNFRSDRMRQITHSLTDSNFNGFERQKRPVCDVVTMTAYADDINATVAFAKETPKQTLGDCVANAKLKQLRLAETEKYAHVTFFFNGGKEQALPLEDRILVPSPKVKTYDLKPEMSAEEVTSELSEAIKSEQYALIICNYANADMVGHTGDIDATIKAIGTLDNCFKKLEKVRQTHPYELLVTADHGNAEKMLCEQSNHKHTAHTNSKVPFLHVGRLSKAQKKAGTLIDIAPTVLYLLQLKIPNEMTGTTLLALD